MKEISLTQGQFALVDDADYDELSKYKWYANKESGSFYATRNFPLGNGKQYPIRMHRQILGLEKGDKRQGDHINHNTLDNRRNNIRICIGQQNMMNQMPNRNTTSRFKGVSWHKQDKKWQVRIGINKKVKYLGSFVMEEVAALAYDMAAIREHGEFACLNF